MRLFSPSVRIALAAAGLLLLAGCLLVFVGRQLERRTFVCQSPRPDCAVAGR